MSELQTGNIIKICDILVKAPDGVEIEAWMHGLVELEKDYQRLKNAETTRKALNKDYYNRNKDRLKEKSKQNYRNKKIGK